MRALKITAPGRLELQEVPAPGAPGPGQVAIDVRFCGICGTDMHIFAGHRSDVAMPRVMGHEFVGIVREVGSAVTRFKAGDAVTVDPVVACGVCPTCLSGHRNVCPHVSCLGVQTDGAMQDIFVADQASVYAVPHQLPLEYYAIVEPYTVAANAVFRAAPEPGSVCVVFGAGTIGLCAVQVLRHYCSEVICVDQIDSKLEHALEFGATRTVNSRTQDLREAVMGFTGGVGADRIIDAVGLASVMEQAVSIAAPCAVIVNLGFDEREAHIKPVDMTKRELTIVGSRMNNGRFPQVIEWIQSGVLDPRKLIEKVAALEDAQQAFEQVSDPSLNLRKVLLRF